MSDIADGSAIANEEDSAILEVAAFDGHGEFVETFGADVEAAKAWRKVNRTHSLRYRHVTPWSFWIGPLDSELPAVRPIHRPTVSAHWTWHRAAKEWVCHMCEGVIPKGERYAKCSYTYVAEFRGAEQYHVDCAPVAEAA